MDLNRPASILPATLRHPAGARRGPGEVRAKPFGSRGKTRIGCRCGNRSGAAQPEKLFEKAPRDDKSEPPKGHSPRCHRFDPRRL